MKTLPLYLLIYLLITSLTSSAQPDIKKSIFIEKKFCYEPTIYHYRLLSHSNGSLYGTSWRLNANNNLDGYLYKLDAQRDTIWSKHYGGSEEDKFLFIKELQNHHILLGGMTSSNDGDVPYGHSYTASEIWLLEVDEAGHIIKGKTFGGSGSSDLTDLIVSKDGSIYTAGSTIAKDYDFAHFSYGFWDSDSWFAKLDSDLNLKWVKAFSGNEDEGDATLQEVMPNRLIGCFATASTNAEMHPQDQKGQFANPDLLCNMMDSMGNVIWTKRFGGSSGDDINNCVIDTVRKHIYLIGFTRSGDFDISYITSKPSISVPLNHSINILLMKIDTSGNLLFGKAYGDTLGTNFSQMNIRNVGVFKDNELWFFGTSDGGGGDMEPDTDGPKNEIFLGVADTNLNMIAKMTIQSAGSENVYQAFIHENKVTLNGYSGDSNLHSFCCDTLSVFGFMIAFDTAPLALNHMDSELQEFTLFPNPTNDKINILIPEKFQHQTMSIRLASQEGQLIDNRTYKAEQKAISFSTKNLPPGNYIITIQVENRQISKQFYKQ